MRWLSIKNVESFISIGYYTVVQKVLSDYNPKCVSNIKDATVMITDLLKTDDGVKYIEKKFK